MVYESRLLVLC